MMMDHKTWRAVAALELDLLDVERMGRVLYSLGTSDEVHTEAVFFMGRTLLDTAERLRKLFEVALNEAKAKDTGQCA